jgi:hypothetical protein
VSQVHDTLADAQTTHTVTTEVMKLGSEASEGINCVLHKACMMQLRPDLLKLRTPTLHGKSLINTKRIHRYPD